MSAFCVFGMTEPLAKKLASDAAAKRRLTREEQESMTPEKNAEWIAEKSIEILEAGKARQVSPAFDAPQFCKDWMDIAKKTANAKRLRVMVRGEKKDKRGAVMRNKRTGKPTITWLPYKE